MRFDCITFWCYTKPVPKVMRQKFLCMSWHHCSPPTIYQCVAGTQLYITRSAVSRFVEYRSCISELVQVVFAYSIISKNGVKYQAMVCYQILPQTVWNCCGNVWKVKKSLWRWSFNQSTSFSVTQDIPQRMRKCRRWTSLRKTFHSEIVRMWSKWDLSLL